MNPLFYKMLQKTKLPQKTLCPKCSLELDAKPDQETKCIRCGVIIPPQKK